MEQEPILIFSREDNSLFTTHFECEGRIYGFSDLKNWYCLSYLGEMTPDFAEGFKFIGGGIIWFGIAYLFNTFWLWLIFVLSISLVLFMSFGYRNHSIGFEFKDGYKWELRTGDVLVGSKNQYWIKLKETMLKYLPTHNCLR